MKAVALLLLVLAVAYARKPAIDTAIIQAVNSANAGWVAGPQKHFEGWTRDQAKALMGAILEGGPKLPMRKNFTAEQLKAVPESYDVRDQWKQLCPSTAEVRDQSNCGSCWAFGAVEAMTDRICIASKGGLKKHLSAQDMLSCCDSCGFGCSGGFPGSAWDYWQETGLVTGGNYGDKSMCYSYFLPECDHHLPQPSPKNPCPATVDAPDCANKCENGAPWAADKVHGASAYSVSSAEEQIKAELFNHGPVEAAFSVYDDFLTYKKGVYRHVSGSMLGGHAVKMIGYGTEDGVKYWTIVNSWNEDWGDKGIFKILRGKNECGIEGQLVAGLPKL